MMYLRRWAINRGDLILGLAALGAFSFFAVQLALPTELQTKVLGGSPDKALLGAIVAGWTAIVVAGVGGALRITSARQSLMSLFASEIKAMHYGLSAMDMFQFWAQTHAAPDVGASGFADVPRSEDYFQLFHAVGNNIGNLHPKIVEAVVRYYTYLKMSRDAAAALASWEKQTDSDIRKQHVVYVIKLLSISMLWSFVALRFMGLHATAQETGFLKKIGAAYDAVLGSGSFYRLFAGHVRGVQLSQFFGPAHTPRLPE